MGQELIRPPIWVRPNNLPEALNVIDTFQRWADQASRVINNLTISQSIDSVKIGSVNGPSITSGSGDPEGFVSAIIGSLYFRTDGSTSTTLYVKESGTGNTGWVAK